MATKERVYWDSSVFLAFLKQEEGRYKILRQWIERAENREVEIVASVFSLCEVARGPEDLLPEDQEQLIVEFFDNPYILIQQLDEAVARRARALVRELGIPARDAVHIASALQTQVAVLHAYDKHLLNCSGKVGDPPLRIEEPRWKDDQPPLPGTLC